MEETSYAPNSPYRLGVAPMEGVTDFPMRLWLCHTSGPDFTATPFLRATAGFPKKDIPEEFFPEGVLFTENRRTPCIPQIMAAQTDHFLWAAERLMPYTSAIDMNCGCPAPTVIGRGAGSSLLQDPPRFARRMEKVARAIGADVFGIKMRTGFDHDRDFPELIEGLKTIPLRRLTIHGRTKAQGYKGNASWDAIAMAAQNLASSTMVVASGDLVDQRSFLGRRRSYPEIKEAIIGRGILRNPWLIPQLKSGDCAKLSQETLIFSLAVLTLYHELFYERFEEFKTYLRDKDVIDPFMGNDEQAWRNLYQTLALTFNCPESPYQLEVSRRSLGRLKQLWHYLRSSLPEAFFAPETMRSKTAGDFFKAIANLEPHTRDIDLCYGSQHDPLYAGMGREQ